MKLRQLIHRIPEITLRGNREIEVRDLSSNSQIVAPGDLFIARKGKNCDGSHYIAEAIQAGAVAVMTDLYNPFLKQPQLLCSDPGKFEARLAAKFYQHPSRELCIIGVTGSKGKTTTSYLLHHLLTSSGLISTVETIFGKERFPSHFTTHEPIYNQKMLRKMVLFGCRSATLEVSSHGLALGRVDEVAFQVGVFTNLFPDHLDFHGTLEEYAKAKKKLFSQITEKAIFNADSIWSAFMQEGCAAKVFTYGIETASDLMARSITVSSSGTELYLQSSTQSAFLRTSLIGRHNVYNLLAAASVGLHLHMPLTEIAERLSTFQNVPGRLERIPNNRGFHVFVDYAHTGEALASVLQSLRSLFPARLLVLFGCGGNRDPSRRSGMAQAAERYADAIVLTNDNPRSEDPEEILRQILSNFQKRERVALEADRKRAIALVLALAKPGDIVLLAGKGHEKTQTVGNIASPFDDVAIAKELLF